MEVGFILSEAGGDFMEAKFVLSGGGGGFKSHTPLLFIPHAAIKSDISPPPPLKSDDKITEE